MAENNEISEKQLDALREIENAQKRIDELLKRQAVSNEKNAKKLQAQIDDETKLIKLKQSQVKAAEDEIKKLKYKEEKLKEINETQNYFSKLGKDVQKNLKGNNEAISAFASISSQIVANKEKQINATDEEREVLQKIIEQQESQRDSVAKLVIHQQKKNSDTSIEESVRKRMAGATEDEIRSMIILEKIKAKIEKREERIHELQHQISHLTHALPEGITNAAQGFMGMISSIKKAGLAMAPMLLGIAALGMALHVFTELDQAAENYRKNTGFTAAMTEKIDKDVHHIAMEYRKFGVDAAVAYEAIDELANAQSDVFHYAEGTVASIAVLNKSMGVSVKDSAAVVSNFEQIGGLSESAAASVAVQIGDLAAKAGVSAKEVYADMAKSAGVLSKYLKGNVKLFTEQAIKAKMLGTSLEETAKVADNLLNFEQSIEEELTAATFVGGQFNLTQARALAYAGKTADANEEILNQIQRSGDFRKQDYFTQQQLAKAAGKNVEDIVKELGIRDKLAKLGGDQLARAKALVESGVDISQLNDEEVKKRAEALANEQKIAGVMTDIQNRISGIIESVGGNLTPAFDLLGSILVGILTVVGELGKGFKFMQDNALAMAIGVGAITLAMGFLIAAKIKALMLSRQQAAATQKEAMAEGQKAGFGIWASLAKIPFGVGLLLAAATVLAMFAGISALFGKGDDVYSPGQKSSGYGNRILAGPEGAIQLNNNDDVIAGTKLFNNKQSQSSLQPSVSPVAAANNNLMGALIAEFRGVRQDMASGRIGVYMDGSKVTANVTNTIVGSTRNNFALQ